MATGETLRLFTSGALALAITLAPAITLAQDKVKEGIYQLVGNQLIPTKLHRLKGHQIDGCKLVNGNKIYISSKGQAIETGFFFDVSASDLKTIENSPNCIDNNNLLASK